MTHTPGVLATLFKSVIKVLVRFHFHTLIIIILFIVIHFRTDDYLNVHIFCLRKDDTHIILKFD